MAQRDASVRLSLNAGSFAGGLRQVSREASRVGTQIGRAISVPLKAGFAAGRNAAGALMNDIKGALKAATSLGGAIGAGAGVKNALEMRSIYADLAFNISKTGKEAVTWQQIQTAIEPVALRTSRTSHEMAGAFKEVFEATGDAEFTKASMDTIADAANATGYSVTQLANAAQIMQRKFGASTQDMPDMMAAFVEKVGVGGASIDSMGPKFAAMAGEAAAAGLKGKEGMSTLLGVMVALDSRVGEKAAPGLKMLLERLKKGSSELKNIEKKSKLEFGADTSAFDKIRAMLSGKGRTVIEASLTGDSRTVFDELAKPFDEAMRKAKEGGATTKEATAAGLAAFDKAMEEAGRSSLTAAKIAEDSQKRQEEPQRKLQKAMETFYQAFTKPEMLSAMDELSQSLPKLAEGMAKIVEFVTRNPLLAGGLYAGARVGGSAAGAAVQSTALTVSKKAFAGIGAMIAEDAAKSGKWATAGKAIGVAAAALLAYELGKNQIDKALNKDQELLSKLNIATERARTIAADPQATKKEKTAALNELRAAKAAKEREGTSTLGAVFGGAAALITGDKSLDPAERGAQSRAKAGQMIEVLGGQLGDTSDNARRAAAAFDLMTTTATRAAAELNKIKGAPTGSNGLPPQPPRGPGAAP